RSNEPRLPSLRRSVGRRPLLGAQLAERDREGLRLAVAQDFELDRRARALGAYLLRQIARVMDRLTVHRDDHITGPDSGLRGRAVRLQRVNQRAADLLEAHRVRDLGGHRLDLHAEAAAGDMTIVLELRDHALRGRGWDIEADSVRFTP